jgi:hypothetical protein
MFVPDVRFDHIRQISSNVEVIGSLRAWLQSTPWLSKPELFLPFRIRRCFRSEFRRVIPAFAARASFPVAGCRSAFDAFVLPAIGIIGDAADEGVAGCMFMGPVVGFLVGMRDNSVVPKLFKMAFTVDHGLIRKLLRREYRQKEIIFPLLRQAKSG